MRILCHLFTAILTATMLLGGASAASAGLVGDTYHEVTDSPVGEEAVCVIVEESSAVFGAEFGEPFGSAFAEVAAALRTVETAYCDGLVAVPPSGRNVRESVPPEARPVYDLAPVFPCAFSAEFARQIPDQPLRDLFTATYGTLGCDDHQFLPPENRL